ncbi:FMN-dependent NADH-azoreductase [Paenibacillus lignilyticus]|uniref:FMN dependent NADH:quinone oxidoreductase n=1 Tax=Paenibacillus lignilyticus TaxID=1172615 RepID=A0ABS5CNA7_9BACL|nr:NAD(P)H-dependent oxidoreductase [Paenibacillus lignilyticus]MBP3967338.1 NAD(P)H-dependent oxidoreductase [Paenibacillus lignilyticus]
MANMLIINAHPKVDSKESFSLRVLEHFLKEYKKFNPEDTIEQINLYEDYIPLIDRTLLEAREKMATGIALNDSEQSIIARTNEILKKFKEVKKYVIVMPLHNFNIPSKLKDYMDHVIAPRETYKFTENGAVGLLDDGRSLLVIQGSGSIYTNNNWYTEVEFSHKYLKAMFDFLGVKDYQIVRAQGTSILNPEEVMQQAYRIVEDAAKHLSIVTSNN